MAESPEAVAAPDLAAVMSGQGRHLRDEALRAWEQAIDDAGRGRGRVDPLTVAARLRATHPEVDPAVLTAALDQARLTVEARARMGRRAEGLLLTRDGLEQASRPAVADRRAARLAAAGVRRVGDLGCGLGLDALAMAGAGITVTAVERDPVLAAMAAANLAGVRPCGPGRPGDGSTRVVCADATDPATLAAVLAEVDAVFVDPARRLPGGPRQGGRALPERDPGRWSPPWPWVLDVAARQGRTVAKVAPGIPRDLAPDGAQTEWVSVDGTLVEACIWFPGLADPAARRVAVVLREGAPPGMLASRRRHDDGPRAPVDGTVSSGDWVLEPDDAVTRAGLVADLALLADGHLVHPRVALVACAAEPGPLATRLGRPWRVQEVLPDAPRPLRAALRERGVGRVVVKTRGVSLDPAAFARTLRLAGRGTNATVLVTRTSRGGRALLVERA